MVSKPFAGTPLSVRKKRGLVSLESPSSSAQLLTNNDDEEERRQRRRSRQLSVAIASPLSAQRSGSESLPQDGADRVQSPLVLRTAHMSNTQLADHYANCIKLSSENKINAKNAFGLHLIDHMKDLLQSAQKDGDVTNFQIASCALDAGVKIYAGRVDSVHSDAYKMLGSLGRATDNQDQGDGGVVGEDGAVQTAKQKRGRNPGKSIETNLRNINCDDFDLAFEVDPFFRQTTTLLEEGGTTGLLLNNITCSDDAFALMIDSTVVPVMATEGGVSSASDTCDSQQIRGLLPSNVQESDICPVLSGFKFCGWDSNDLSTSFHGIDAMVGKENNQHKFDMNASVVEFDGGDDDYGVDDYDDGLADGDGRESLAFNDGRSAIMAHSESGILCPSGDLCLQLSMAPSDYSYFQSDIINSWAGPKHWKVKGRIGDSLFGNSTANASRKRQPKKPALIIDFKSEINLIEPFKIKRAATTLTSATLEKYAVQEQLLPEDFHYKIDNLFRLFTKPRVRVSRQRNAIQMTETDAPWYDYDNQNDRHNYCPNVQDSDSDHGDFGADDPYDDNMGLDTMSQETVTDPTAMMMNSFAGGNLVEAPNKVQRIHMDYAKAAKKIDIKRLKRSMWNVLHVFDREENKENGEIENRSEKINDEETILKNGHTFSSVYTTLPSKVSSNMAKNLSVPIAFVCMLYLANEKNLELTPGASLSDFLIAQNDAN